MRPERLYAKGEKPKFDFLTFNQRALRVLFSFMRATTLDTVIISSLISAVSAILVCLISSIWNNKLIAYRLEQLEKKMDKHNSVIDRVYKLEKDVAVLFDHIDSDDGK